MVYYHYVFQCLKKNKILKIKKDYRLRLTKIEHDLIKEMRVSDGGVVNNVLVIGDLHEPFCLDKYLEFCVSKYEQFDCTEVVFIGDCLDNHYEASDSLVYIKNKNVIISETFNKGDIKKIKIL